MEKVAGVGVEDVGAGDEDPVDVVGGEVLAVGVLREADGLEEEREGGFVNVECLGYWCAVGDEGHPTGGARGEAGEEGGREGRFAVDAAAVCVDRFVVGEVLLADGGAGAVGADEEEARGRGAVFEGGGDGGGGGRVGDELLAVGDVGVEACEEDSAQDGAVAGVDGDAAAGAFAGSAGGDGAVDGVEVGLAGFTFGTGGFEILPELGAQDALQCCDAIWAELQSVALCTEVGGWVSLEDMERNAGFLEALGETETT